LFGAAPQANQTDDLAKALGLTPQQGTAPIALPEAKQLEIKENGDPLEPYFNGFDEGRTGEPLAEAAGQSDAQGAALDAGLRQDADANATLLGQRMGELAEDAGNVGKIITKIEYKPSSGVIFKANPNKTTTILGSFDKDMKNIVNEMGNVKSTDFGARKGGFNVLNVPDELYDPNTFWDLYNKPWLDEAINRGDDIVLATKPDENVLTRIDYSTGQEVLTGFGQEIDYLTQKGYVYDVATNTMKFS